MKIPERAVPLDHLDGSLISAFPFSIQVARVISSRFLMLLSIFIDTNRLDL
jgi:hypothetical protein